MPPISDKDRKGHLDRALAAADWFVNAQFRLPKPWMGDQGRYAYYYYMPEGKAVPGGNWTHGRALFVLTEAYRITRRQHYMDSMNLAGHFIRALQPLDAACEVTYGAIHEETPQAPRGGVLDGAQLASGMLMLHQVTGEADWLRRGRAFVEFLRRTWRPDAGVPCRVDFHPEKVAYMDSDRCIHHAALIPAWHVLNMTGEGQYAPLIVDAADRILTCQRDDGAMLVAPDVGSLEPPKPNQHDGIGDGLERFILRNDDGIVTVVLAAHRITRQAKYLDAMVRYADWIVANEPHERPRCAFGIQAANVLDIGRVAGRDYAPWVLDHLRSHCLDLQVCGTGDAKADGGFRGEDEEGDTGVFGGTGWDYVVTRNTCYMAGLLLRLSGEGTGAGFSVFGMGGSGRADAAPRWGP